MSGKHTPGPWAVEENAIMAAVGTHICTVSTSDDFPCITESDDKTEAEVRADCDIECEANARLIAAAPELLDALKLFVAAFHVPLRKDEADALVAARAAIAKAEGQS